MAAAIARRHPSLIEGRYGPVDIEAPVIVQRWAARLASDMKLVFATSYNNGLSVELYDVPRQGTLLKPAFDRANAIDKDLGMQLVSAIEALSYRFGMVLTPASLFCLASQQFWYGETDQEAFVRSWLENNAEPGEEPSEESLAQAKELEGPDAFFDAFPGMPPDVAHCIHQRISDSQRAKRAERYWRQAARARTEWECELMLAMSALADFEQARFSGIYDLMGNNGGDYFQHAQASYYIAWSESDNMEYWADEVGNDIWNDGMAHDALLQFEFGNANAAQVDDLVGCVEACCDHHKVMDQVLDVLRQASEETNAS